MSDPKESGQAGMLNQPVSRRGVIKYAALGFAGLATVAGVLTPIIAYLWPPKREGSQAGEPVAVATTVDLPPGKAEVYSVNNEPVIVINTPDGVKALSAVCTHLGCIVFWDEERGAIACPCHAAFFTTAGAVISGPPPAPLAAYEVQVVGDQIFVKGGSA